jgi:hypothetical protein
MKAVTGVSVSFEAAIEPTPLVSEIPPPWPAGNGTSPALKLCRRRRTSVRADAIESVGSVIAALTG